MRGVAFSVGAPWGVLLVVACAGCGSATPEPEPKKDWTGPGEGMTAASSGTPVERFFPLVDGHIYHYETHSDSGDTGMLVARIHRQDDKSGSLRFPSGDKRFEYKDDGVVISTPDGPAYVLKAPLQVGNEWRGEHGGKSRVSAVDASVTTKAGSFTGCVVVSEQRLGDVPVRYDTTYCPDVGIVRLEASAGMNQERAELKSFGPPVDIGPDGLVRTQ